MPNFGHFLKQARNPNLVVGSRHVQENGVSLLLVIHVQFNPLLEVDQVVRWAPPLAES